MNYYISMLAKMGGVEKTQNFCRLFMAPGMMHCGSGPVPNMFGNMLDLVPAQDPQHNIFAALENWLEKGAAPERIIATKYNQDNTVKGAAITRPLCPFPQQT